MIINVKKIKHKPLLLPKNKDFLFKPNTKNLKISIYIYRIDYIMLIVNIYNNISNIIKIYKGTKSEKIIKYKLNNYYLTHAKDVELIIKPP